MASFDPKSALRAALCNAALCVALAFSSASTAQAAAAGPSAPSPTRAERSAFAAIPYDHLQAARWELAAVGGVLAFVGFRDWGWGGSRFRTIDEGWFGSNTRHGGMDKIGHGYFSFVVSDLLTRRIRESAADPAGAELTGALLGFGVMNAVELLDGFTGKHRFSTEDVIANGAGALFAYVRNTVPGLQEKLDFRIMFTPASYERPGVGSTDGLFAYQRQRYYLALKGSGFKELRDTPLRWFEVQAGFSARGFQDRERERGYPIERSFHVGIGLNLNEILFSDAPFRNLAPYRKTFAGDAAIKLLDYVQVPYAGVHHDARFSRIDR